MYPHITFFPNQIFFYLLSYAIKIIFQPFLLYAEDISWPKIIFPFQIFLWMGMEHSVLINLIFPAPEEITHMIIHLSFQISYIFEHLHLYDWQPFFKEFFSSLLANVKNPKSSSYLCESKFCLGPSKMNLVTLLFILFVFKLTAFIEYLWCAGY